MNITAKIVVGLTLTATASMFAVTAYAQERPAPTGTNQQQQTSQSGQNGQAQTQTTAATEQRKQLSADEQKELKTRLEKRKAELKTKLSAADQQKLKTKCKSSQSVVAPVGERVKTIENNRTEVYGGLISRLSIMSSRLQNQGMDKQLIQVHIDALQAMIKTYETDLATYKQSLTDLQAMDCAADPTAFKASLESARAAQTKLKADAKAIRTYVNDSVKPTLQQVRGQL